MLQYTSLRGGRGGRRRRNTPRARNGQNMFLEVGDFLEEKEEPFNFN